MLEDDDDVRTYSVECLRELGYRVVEAHDGPSALRLLERQTRVDLLFTDVVLPGGMTGRAGGGPGPRAPSRARKCSSRRVMRATPSSIMAACDKGVQLLTKPFSFGDLAAKVRDALDDI